MVEAAAGSAAKEFKKESAAARLLGSGTSIYVHYLQAIDENRVGRYRRASNLPSC